MEEIDEVDLPGREKGDVERPDNVQDQTYLTLNKMVRTSTRVSIHYKSSRSWCRT